MITKGEKIFSLFQSANRLPERDDIQAQWHEFFCYLFLALLFDEGHDPLVSHERGELGDSRFNLVGANVYHSEIGRVISKGLFERFYLLFNNPDRSEKERDVLNALNYVFIQRAFVSRRLKASDLLAICQMRDLKFDTIAVVDHLSVMIGQSDFYHTASPTVFFSLFGNIYLDKSNPVSLIPPALIYGQAISSGETITGLWSLLSAMVDSFIKDDYPGDRLGETVTRYAFMSHDTASEFIPLPKIVSVSFLQNLLGLNSYNPVYTSALFYKQFLYGSIEAKKVTRHRMMDLVMRQLSDGVGDGRADYLFRPGSHFVRLTTDHIQSSTRNVPHTPLYLKMAVEALDADVDTDAAGDDTGINEPAVGLDSGEPVAPSPENDDFENSMDLVSFNKAGEGINEDLFRSAVVALNDRMQSDSSFPVTSETKQALNQWVNGWLYRAAIAATKDQIAALKLTQYLKSVSHIPTK